MQYISLLSSCCYLTSDMASIVSMARYASQQQQVLARKGNPPLFIPAL